MLKGNVLVPDTKTVCYHCGDECRSGAVVFDSKNFCCEGCRLVYDILLDTGLTSYYSLNTTPGTSPAKAILSERFSYLDTPAVKEKLVRFTDGKITHVVFSVPQIHCSSCIWLLEHLSRLVKGITHSQVNFIRKEVAITFDENHTSLRHVVERLASIGYEPQLVFDDLQKKTTIKDRSAIYKIGIAGFCFGNIMLFSFPEYFSSGKYDDHLFNGIFSYLNFALSLPVFFYCSTGFFKTAWLSIRQKFLNIDVPIALGILVMFLRSCYEIFSRTGAGYMDTMAGLVFFMLAGRAFQNKTYETISFDRDYKSFFPVAVMVKRKGREVSIPLSELQAGDRIVVRNNELIPADGILHSGEATVDYSFVTGESTPVQKMKGDFIYAGGKQRGTAIEIEVKKNVSQSYLTQLWNNSNTGSENPNSRFQQLVNKISHYFTVVLISIALLALAYWGLSKDLPRGWNAFTAVLIIACPCALAISSPFTLGNILRVFGRSGFYVKNSAVIEKLAKADTIVFDKTGTLTIPGASQVQFNGSLSEEEEKLVASVIYHSTHALRHAFEKIYSTENKLPVTGFMETGTGISGNVHGVEIKIGLAEFTGSAKAIESGTTKIYVQIGGGVKGYFAFTNEYRQGIAGLAGELKKSGYEIVVMSGDHNGEKENLLNLFGPSAKLLFHQLPADKLRFIQQLQQENKNVLMIGDGLNDAGALKQADVSISVSNNTNNFSPACDGILEAKQFQIIPQILKSAKYSRKIILASFGIALLYNIAGLSFAITGNLSPVIAAVLMPTSAVTIILFTTGLSNLAVRARTLNISDGGSKSGQRPEFQTS